MGKKGGCTRTNIDTIEIPQVAFDANGALIITASETSPEHDFDFFEGKWNLHNFLLFSVGTQGTKTIQFGAKHFLQTMEKLGNGIGICILANLQNKN